VIGVATGCTAPTSSGTRRGACWRSSTATSPLERAGRGGRAGEADRLRGGQVGRPADRDPPRRAQGQVRLHVARAVPRRGRSTAAATSSRWGCCSTRSPPGPGPFSGDNDFEVMTAIVGGLGRGSLGALAGLSAGAGADRLRALSPRREDRFATAQELSRALGAFAASRGWCPSAAGLAALLAATFGDEASGATGADKSAGHEVSSTADTARRGRRRRRWIGRRRITRRRAAIRAAGGAGLGGAARGDGAADRAGRGGGAGVRGGGGGGGAVVAQGAGAAAVRGAAAAMVRSAAPVVPRCRGRTDHDYDEDYDDGHSARRGARGERKPKTAGGGAASAGGGEGEGVGPRLAGASAAVAAAVLRTHPRLALSGMTTTT
jgi:hypothetical protein